MNEIRNFIYHTIQKLQVKKQPLHVATEKSGRDPSDATHPDNAKTVHRPSVAKTVLLGRRPALIQIIPNVIAKHGDTTIITIKPEPDPPPHQS